MSSKLRYSVSQELCPRLALCCIRYSFGTGSVLVRYWSVLTLCTAMIMLPRSYPTGNAIAGQNKFLTMETLLITINECMRLYGLIGIWMIFNCTSLPLCVLLLRICCQEGNLEVQRHDTWKLWAVNFPFLEPKKLCSRWAKDNNQYQLCRFYQWMGNKGYKQDTLPIIHIQLSSSNKIAPFPSPNLGKLVPRVIYNHTIVMLSTIYKFS